MKLIALLFLLPLTLLAEKDRLILVGASYGKNILAICEPDGTVIWVNSRAENTPIHLSPEDFSAALPGQWEARASRAGEGLWAVARRRHDAR